MTTGHEAQNLLQRINMANYKNWVLINADLKEQSYVCGYCGKQTGNDRGYNNNDGTERSIRICPYCGEPTYLHKSKQVPGAPYGSEVEHLPDGVGALYRETRECIKAGLHTASVLSARKLLMHIAVDQGADEGKPFIVYVQYLADNGYVPPHGKGWVDHIRKQSNEANHEIVIKERADAVELVTFLEMLLKFIYEFPAKIPPPPPSPTP